MLDHRFARRLAGLALAGGLALPILALGGIRRTPVRPAPVRAPIAADTLAFDVEYGGIGAEGVDLLWRGRAGGAVPAQVTIRMEYAGGAGDRHMPVWPVNVRLFYAAEDYRSSFAAELTGSMNWRTGEMHTSGVVSDGARRDAPIEQHVLLRPRRLAGSATVVFPPTAGPLAAQFGGR